MVKGEKRGNMGVKNVIGKQTIYRLWAQANGPRIFEAALRSMAFMHQALWCPIAAVFQPHARG